HPGQGGGGGWLPPEGGGEHFPPSGELLIEIPSSVRARIGVPLNLRLTAQDAVNPVYWESAGAAFPPGIRLDAEAGALVGIPTEIGTSGSIVLRALDDEGREGISGSFVADV